MMSSDISPLNVVAALRQSRKGVLLSESFSNKY